MNEVFRQLLSPWAPPQDTSADAATLGAALSDAVHNAGVLENEIDVLEKNLQNTKGERDKILSKIVGILDRMGARSVTTEDGIPVSVAEHYNVKVVDALALADWLDAAGMGSIVKTGYSFPKGEDTASIDAVCSQLGIDYEKEVGIHPMTLKKAIREIHETTGVVPPPTAAVVSVFRQAKISK